MLSALLKTVQEQFPKSYWLAGVLPTLLFLVANAFLLGKHSQKFKDWFANFADAEEKTFLYGSVLIGILLLSYLLFTLSSVLIEMLEGRRGPLRWISWILLPGQKWILDCIDSASALAYIEGKQIAGRASGWQNMLVNANGIGSKTFTGTDRRHLRFLRRLQSRRRMGRRIPFDDLDKGVAALSKLIEEFRCENGRELDKARMALLEVIKFAMDRALYEKVRLYNLRQFSFPGSAWTFPSDPEPSSNNVLAPTTMGNIGRTMRSYGLTRYQIDLDVFWTRLLNTLQKNAGTYYSVIQDSKTQVDCMVSLVWLTALFTIIWSALLFWQFETTSLLEFSLVGFGGTLLTIVWYDVACQGYRVFADLIRSSVDLYRFELIESLHLAAPYGTEEERELWLRIGSATGFSSDAAFVYKHPKP
jgi:hypothetical protein